MVESRLARRVAAVAVLCVLAGCGDTAARPPRASSSPIVAPPSAVASAPLAAPSAVASASASAAPLASARLPENAPPPADSDVARAFDMHCDTPWQVGAKGRNIALETGHITPETVKKGHVGGIFFAIYISDDLHKGAPTIADADAIFDTVNAIVDAHPESFVLATKGDVPDDKVAAFVSIEGAGAFATDITQIDRFIQRGVRFVGPVHMKDDALASSATGKDHSYGLTELGRSFCDRVYDDGALVDVSHMSDEGFADVVEIAKKHHAPIVATHSNARSVADHPRNLNDAELRAIADSGGVAGINFYHDYLRAGGKATMADAVKQALYMVKIAGIDHVGLGSDFDGGTPAKGLDDASRYPAFAKALRDAGLSAGDVHKIFSENVKRVLRWRPKVEP